MHLVKLDGSRNELKLYHEKSHVLFSIVVPVYDRTQKLRESVRSLLDQDFDSYEVLLVTDGSPFDTMEVVEELEENARVRVFSLPINSGNACRGRNKGIEMAHGTFVCFHDSDDIAHPRRLQRTWDILKNDEFDGIYGPTKILMDGTRRVPGIKNGQLLDPPEFSFDLLKQTNIMMTCSVTVRRQLLLMFGGFREEMRYREDHELWLRLSHHGCRWKRADDVLCYYRLHAGNAELHLRDDDKKWFKEAIRLFSEPYIPIPSRVKGNT